MPLKKILLKPGVNRENTRYTTEGGWYDCDKIRFRQGTPEVIGGWQRFSPQTFLGVCRSLWAWTTLNSVQLVGVGTNEKFYIERGASYYDITPFTEALALTDPFTATDGLAVVNVYQASHGYSTGDYVIFYSATSLGGNITAAVLNQQFTVTVVDTDNYTITVSATANASDTGHGGTCYVAHQVSPGPAYAVPLSGWGSGSWGSGSWGNSDSSEEALRLWNQSNFGEDLIFGYRGGPLYYWNATFNLTGLTTFSVTVATPGVISTTISVVDGETVVLSTTGTLPTGLVPGKTYYAVNSTGTTFQVATTAGGTPINTSGSQSGVHSFSPRATLLSAQAGASEVPLYQNYLLVSDASRFVFALGTNDIFTSTLDPMLIRWSDQENPVEWSPAVTNQAGSIRLSHGSQIVTAVQTRQEVLVFTDTSLYSLQYLGPPFIWGSQILGDNISIASQNAAAVASNVVFWMGVDKFYMYDGTVKTMRCDLRQYIFEDINTLQLDQVFAGTSEGFNEVWWFYCSSTSDTVDRYVIYNYAEDIWCYGTMARTAWLDSGILGNPIAATYSRNLVTHESGVNDGETGTDLPLNAFITSSEFDIDDGHNFSFIWRMLPDITFRGSTANTSPQVMMYLYPLKNSGSGYTTPASVGGENNAAVTQTVAYPIEEFTGQIYTRVRGRQMAMKIVSNQLGTTWQLGAPRIDIRQDGRR
jgi:hypothetical protein